MHYKQQQCAKWFVLSANCSGTKAFGKSSNISVAVIKKALHTLNIPVENESIPIDVFYVNIGCYMNSRLKKILAKNFIFAFLAQTFSLFSGFVVQFLGPRFLDVSDFAYWQLFLLYVYYGNISRFGIVDGMHLKLGGKARGDLDKELIKTEFWIFTVYQILCAAGVASIVAVRVQDPDRRYVWMACAAGMVLLNIYDYWGYLFQAINETSVYSVSEVIFKFLWLVAIAMLPFADNASYKIIVRMFLLGQLFAVIYLMNKAQFILRCKFTKISYALKDMKENMRAGMPLLLVMYATMFITGGVRMVVDGKWSVEAFSYFSFSISLTTFLLKFINQVSMVIFPALRMIESEKQKLIFSNVNNAIALMLPCCLLAYIPLKVFVSWWLPEYSVSLYYLGILLPMCIFDGKMQLLYSTFLRVIRKEKFLLYINLFTASISILLAYVSAYVFESLAGVAWGLSASVAIRSILSGIALNRWMDIKSDLKLIAGECVVAAIFSGLSGFENEWIILGGFVLIYSLYLFNNRELLIRIKQQKTDGFFGVSDR